MTKPLLDCSCRNTVCMVHCGKGLAEPMKNPMLTTGRIRAGDHLAIQRACAMTAVKSGSQRPLFKHSQEVTLGISLAIGKDQPAIRMHGLAHLQDFEERIRNWHRSFFLVLWIPVPLPFLQHTDSLQLEVNVGVAGMGDFVLAKSCTKKELPNLRLFVD